MSRFRSRQRRARGPRFLWQILLVVPPVVILSAVSLVSLRNDRASIEQDARDRATVLADELARRVGERIQAELAAARPLSGLILDGRIRVPVDHPPLPSPPAWVLGLTGAQASQWRIAASATPAADLATVQRAVTALAGAPIPVRANAEWFLARAQAARDAGPAASQRLIDLAARYPDALSESGTPLADLALLLALARYPAGKLPAPLVHDLVVRAVEHPSFMTPALLDEAARRAPGDAAVAALGARWRANEQALELLRRLPAGDMHAGEVGLDGDNEAWVAMITPLAPRSDAGGSARAAFHVTLVPASFVEGVLRPAVAAGATAVPGYASVRLQISDRVWRTAGPPQGDRPIELAAAVGRFDVPLLVPSDSVALCAADLLRAAPSALPPAAIRQEGPVTLTAPSSAHAFTIGVDLAVPDALYASYHRRFWLAMGLILTATVAALAGLASTWNAFQRQRRLSEMKSNFVASVSHELRAPIAAVRLMTESLERGTIEGDDRRQEYLRTIVQECRRLSSLVENVLDFSRIDRGRTQYTFEPADLRALVAQTVELMQPYATQRRVSLVHAAAAAGAGPLERSIDRQAIQQALVNLIDNAVKHSPAGADVTVGIEVGAGATTSLFVEDRGPGIPAEDLDRIFEPFYRRGSELRRETQGIGIGLSIVKHIAEAHSGRVVVRSAPGAGSRFAIELSAATEAKP